MPYQKRGFCRQIQLAFSRYVAVLVGLLLLFWIVFMIGTLVAASNANHRANANLKAKLDSEIGAYQAYMESTTDNPLYERCFQEKVSSTELYQELYDFVRARECGSLFYVIDQEGDILLTNAWSARDSYTATSHDQRQFLRRLENGNTDGMCYHESRTGNREICYLIGRRICLTENECGYLVFELLEDELEQMISEKYRDVVILRDDFHRVIASSDDTLVDSLGKFEAKENRSHRMGVNDMDYLVYSSQCELLDIEILTMDSLSVFNMIIKYGVALIFIAALMMIIMISLLSRSVGTRLSRPLEQLQQAIDEFQSGNMDFQLSIDCADEFQYLSHRYMDLTAEIRELVAQNVEIADRARLAEIRELQTQFDPHFIFNILQTIQYMNYEDPMKSVQMIQLLSNLLRYSIGTGKTQVALKDDIQYIQTYLELQKIRLDENLTYDIQIPEEMEDCLIPKLIIQPLVENCIRHGFRRKASLDIGISGELSGADAVLRVTDNGDGISEGSLEKINKKLESSEMPADAHIGLQNTHCRLRLTYGKPYGIQISSREKVGTEILIRFPARRGGTEDVSGSDSGR